MMAMMITSILGGLVMGSIYTMSKITAKLTEQTEDNIEVKSALDVISTNLRGATVDPAHPDKPQIQIAHPGEIRFLTYGGRGFSEEPRIVHYRAKKGKLYFVNPENGREIQMTERLTNGQLFRFYRWDRDATSGKHGNCFVSLNGNELKSEQSRKEIVAVQIQIERLASHTYANRRKHVGTWVRLSEQINPFDPVLGEGLDSWKNTCWETQFGRIG